MKTKNSTVEKRKGGLRNVKYLSGTLFRKMAKGGEKEIQTNADEVNRLNVFPVPDGDTGDNMRLTIESGIRAIENLDTDDLAQVMKLFSHGMLIGARGNSGVILSQFFSGMARGLEKEEKAAPKTIGRALEMGVEDAYTSVLTPTEGTILTVAREAVEYAVSNINEKSTVRTLFADLVGEMQRSLERTPEVLDILKEAGVVDSGGAGLYYIMDGFNRALCGEEIKDTAPKKVGEGVFPNISEQNEDIDLGYCTEFLLQLNRKKKSGASFEIDKFKKALSALGDSLIAFEKEGAVKVHIHTKTPEKAIAYGRKFGEFLTVKIENMSVQHSATAFSKNEKASKKKRYGIVAVSSGDGISEIFRDLGADGIIFGGQTSNPSTKEFLDAFERINAQHIFVLPNNKNIVLTAEQAAKLYKKAKVHVIDSKNVGAGYAALSYANLDAATPKKLLESMESAISAVTTGYISSAVRAAEIGGRKIGVGDTLGFIERELVISNHDRFSAITSLISRLLEDENKTVMTVFCGKDAGKEEKEQLKNYISTHFLRIESYFVDGGQEINSYIFAIE